MPDPRSLNYVGQKPEKTGALDGAREFALLERRHRGDAARHDLAALGNVALQQPHILVIDLRRIGAGEWAGLAPAEERTARASAKSAAMSTFVEAHGASAPSLLLRRHRRAPRGDRAGRRGHAGVRHDARRDRGRGPLFASWPRGRPQALPPAP